MSAADLPAREAMEFDVVIVGAGPAGLAAAIRSSRSRRTFRVVVVEKGSEVGAHILSGAVIDPIGLDRLAARLAQRRRAGHDAGHFRSLLCARALRRACGCRTLLMPPLMSNHGNFIVSLGDVCR